MKKKRIVIIGPFPPFKGGIAQYNNFMAREFTKRADLFLVHSKSEKQKLGNILVAKDSGVSSSILTHLLPLCEPSDNKDSNDKQPDLTQKYSLNLLFFGFVRDYKGLDLLLEALEILKNKNISLTIVGEFWNEKKHYLDFIDLHNIPNVSIVDQYVPDSEVAPYFYHCDVVVLPYKHATGSGIIPMAYGYKKPVLVTNVGGLPDAVLHEKTGYIIEANKEAIAIGIEWFINNRNKDNYKKEISHFVKDKMSWSGLCDLIDEGLTKL